MTNKKTTVNYSGSAFTDAAQAPRPVLRRSLPAQVQEILRSEIMTGVWTPGARLSEIALCERFGVSRTPLREALKGLEAEGLLHVFPNRGAVVAEVTIADIEDKMRVLKALEVLAVEIVCEAATEEELAALGELDRQLTETFVRARKLNDARDFYFGNYSFHQAIVEASHNATLIDLHRHLHRHLQRVRHLVGLTEGDQPAGVEDHHEIVAALTERDADRARGVMARHLDLVLHLLLAAMKAQGHAR